MHYYQFNVGDYVKRTRHLTNTEDLAYRRLIDLYYTNESPMPDDPKQLARIISMRENKEEVADILKEFFELKNGCWHNSRADKEIAFYKSRADRARVNGAKGGRPKIQNNNPEETQWVNLGNPELTQPKAKQQPITNNQETTTNNKINGKAVRFAPPSLKDILDYFNQHQSNDFDGTKFFNYYESNGWMVGKNKMKKWESAASGWISRNPTVVNQQKEAYQIQPFPTGPQ